MEGHVLRKFLYLDADLLDDFLAGLDDVLVDEVVTERAQSSGGVHGEAGAKGLKAGGKKDRTQETEVRREVRVTDAMKFQRLYSLLEDRDAIQYWEAMESSNWDALRRNDLIEAEVELVQSTVGSMGVAAGKLDALMGLMQAVAPDEVDSEAENAIRGITMLTELESQQGIPLRMEVVGSREFKFVAHLNPDALRVGRDELTGEATVLAKIRRKFGPTETMDLFDLTGGLESMAVNREQKRALKKKPLPTEYRNPVKAPAAIVIPIAVYR